MFYHGTNETELEKFSDDYRYSNRSTLILGSGVYTSDDHRDASKYGKIVYSCRLLYSDTFLRHDQPLYTSDHFTLCNLISSLDDGTSLIEFTEYGLTWDIMKWYRYFINFHDHNTTATLIANSIGTYGVIDASRSSHEGIVYCSWFPSYVKDLSVFDEYGDE